MITTAGFAGDGLTLVSTKMASANKKL